MGISTAVSFALLACALILSKFQPYLLLHQVPLRTLLFTRKSFHALSSFFLLAPAVYNLVMTFMWRNSTNPELNFQHRCHPDLDVIWSVSSPRCNSRVWGTWLALSIIRLILTLCIIVSSPPVFCFHAHTVVQIIYHVVSYRTRRPMYSARHQYHYQRRSQQSDSQSSIPPSFAAYLPSDDSPLHSSRPAQHQASDSTLSSHTHSKNSSSQQSPRTLHLHSSMSSLYSGEDAALEAEINEQIAHPQQNQEHSGFVDRFRALISQITRETDLGIEFARHDSMLYDENSSLCMPPVPPAVGYDEFGRPYPPEEHVSFLNGYIRRMPTIESMGSREMGSMTISTGLTQSRRSTATFSQPPTRSNTFSSSAGSQLLSGDSSLVACEIPTALGRTNEMGELVDRNEDGHDPSRRRSGAAMSGNMTSTSTSTSYYSATSSAAPNATEDILLHPPGLDELAREHARLSSKQEFIQ
jgi:hypothetical protein